MSSGDVTRRYHQLSSYRSVDEWRAPAEAPLVLGNFEPDVLETFPAPCKTYPAGLPVVELPLSWPSGTASRGPLDLPQLARLCHLSAGVIRTSERPDGRFYRFRASGSAGGLFPLELYVAARGVRDLADGVYWFDPLRHALVEIGPPPAGDATTLIETGIPWRTGWRYAERGFRHLYWDGGGMLANIMALADDAGLEPRLRGLFPDHATTRLVGADGVQEFPLAIVTLGDRAPAIQPTGKAAAGVVDARVEFPLVTEAQHAGDGTGLGAPWPLSDEPLAPAGLDEVLLRRISARRLDPSRSVGRDLLEWSLATSIGGCRMSYFVAVHAVDGLEAGLYRWPGLDTPIRSGNLRDEMYTVCMDQDLGRDASFVVVSAADPVGLDDRGYRTAQLEAGLVDGRLNLAVSARGIGACGMTFIDPQIPRLIGEPLNGLLVTCVGVPTYRHRPGGPPGSPTRMRLLRPAS